MTVPLLASMSENNIFYCSRANQTEVLMTRFLISCKQTIQDSMKCLRPDVKISSNFDLNFISSWTLMIWASNKLQ